MHYSLGVFVPKIITEDSDVRSYIDKLMEPYSQHVEDSSTRYWDWYKIGGRWNGVAIGKPRDDGKYGSNYGDEFDNVPENITPASTAPVEYFYSILTPAGEWYGTWQDQINAEEKQSLFVRYQDHNVVMVDYHS